MRMNRILMRLSWSCCRFHWLSATGTIYFVVICSRFTPIAIPFPSYLGILTIKRIFFNGLWFWDSLSSLLDTCLHKLKSSQVLQVDMAVFQTISTLHALLTTLG